MIFFEFFIFNNNIKKLLKNTKKTLVHFQTKHTFKINSNTISIVMSNDH